MSKKKMVDERSFIEKVKVFQESSHRSLVEQLLRQYRSMSPEKQKAVREALKREGFIPTVKRGEES